jgi:chromosome partitioning protein
MWTIALAAAKGGVSKTTLAAALAVAAQLGDPGMRIALIDLDPQGSLTHWWNLRDSDQPHLASLDGMPLYKAQADLKSAGFSLLILDCPPGFSSILREAISVADLVVVPTGASALDLEAIASTVEMADEAGVRRSCVLSRAIPRSRLAGEAVRALRDLGWGGLPVVHQRVAVAGAMADGHTVLEKQPGGTAARELMALWHAVRTKLGGPPRPLPRLSAARDRKITVGMPTR